MFNIKNSMFIVLAHGNFHTHMVGLPGCFSGYIFYTILAHQLYNFVKALPLTNYYILLWSHTWHAFMVPHMILYLMVTR